MQRVLTVACIVCKGATALSWEKGVTRRPIYTYDVAAQKAGNVVHPAWQSLVDGLSDDFEATAKAQGWPRGEVDGPEIKDAAAEQAARVARGEQVRVRGACTEAPACYYGPSTLVMLQCMEP